MATSSRSGGLAGSNTTRSFPALSARSGTVARYSARRSPRLVGSQAEREAGREVIDDPHVGHGLPQAEAVLLDVSFDDVEVGPIAPEALHDAPEVLRARRGSAHERRDAIPAPRERGEEPAPDEAGGARDQHFGVRRVRIHGRYVGARAS